MMRGRVEADARETRKKTSEIMVGKISRPKKKRRARKIMPKIAPLATETVYFAGADSDGECKITNEESFSFFGVDACGR